MIHQIEKGSRWDEAKKLEKIRNCGYEIKGEMIITGAFLQHFAANSNPSNHQKDFIGLWRQHTLACSALISTMHSDKWNCSPRNVSSDECMHMPRVA